MIENLTHSETTIGPKRLKLELTIYGWLGCFLKNLQSDQPKEARGKIRPWRSHDHSFKMISNKV